MFESHFRKFASKTSSWVGSPGAFVSAFTLVVLWAALGPVFKFSDDWQLTINTGTTIITFLMVFLIQNTQNRDGRAVQLKLDELIRSISAARNQFLDIERMSDKELDELHQEFCKLQKEASAHINERKARGEFEPDDPSPVNPD